MTVSLADTTMLCRTASDLGSPRSAVFYCLAALFLLTGPVSGQHYIPVNPDPNTWWAKHFPGQPDPTVCPVLLNPENGNVSVKDSPGIVQAVYACNTNYTLVGDSVVRCVCGNWTGQLAVCRRDGHWSSWSEWTLCSVTCGGGIKTRHRSCDNPPPEPGAKKCNGSSTQEEHCSTEDCPACSLQNIVTIDDLTVTVEDNQQSVRFSCPDGFVVVGNATQSCTGLDLANIETSCFESCPVLQHPDNGTVTITEGRVAVYTCQVGFSLQGTRERVCEDGIWTGTDGECVQDLIQVSNESVTPIGANPEFGLGVGIFNIESPDVFIGQCNASVTFNFRSTTSQFSVNVIAALVVNETIIADSTEEVQTSGLSNIQYVCIPLVCSYPETLIFPLVGRARITVTVQDGTVEVSNVNFRERRSCNETVDEETAGSCDDSTESGDCGYRNTGCGTEAFEVTLATDDVDDDDEDFSNTSVPLLNNRTSDICKMYSCLSCIQDSGFSVSTSLRNESVTVAASRRKRKASKVNKQLCLKPKKKKFIGGQMSSGVVKKGEANGYISFGYTMNRNGVHSLHVHVECLGFTNDVHVGNNGVHFQIANNKKGKSGTACLDLHTHIAKREKKDNKKCGDFHVLFEANAAKKNMCVKNIFLWKSKEINLKKCTVGNVPDIK